ACSGISPRLGLNMYAGGSTGLATLRRDGFASMDAGSQPGTLTTRPLVFSGKHLWVNADAIHGELRAELLNQDGTVIAPFHRDNCRAMRTEPLTESSDSDSRYTDPIVRIAKFLPDMLWR